MGASGVYSELERTCFVMIMAVFFVFASFGEAMEAANNKTQDSGWRMHTLFLWNATIILTGRQWA